MTQYRHQVIELIFPQNIVRTRAMTAPSCATIFPESFETTTVVTTIVKNHSSYQSFLPLAQISNFSRD